MSNKKICYLPGDKVKWYPREKVTVAATIINNQEAYDFLDSIGEPARKFCGLTGSAAEQLFENGYGQSYWIEYYDAFGEKKVTQAYHGYLSHATISQMIREGMIKDL